MNTRSFTVIENEWIMLADGTRLAARIWMPDDAENDPVPAVLEFLPYRKRDGTCARDEATYPAFAQAGIAGIRVDIRGSGESDGVIDGEYTPLELANACELVAWIAAQKWSNGSVGMMGISWGGFNCLQVAALHPPALKAVISIASTVDRYNDDIHYKNGTHLSAQLSWAATMLAYQSRSPDPAIVGDRWKEMWLERLENEPFFMEEWLEHQRRDAYWKQGSICEDFDHYNVPSLVIAGWADGYRNTPLKAVEGLGDTAKALIGPWVHKYPHFAWPKPRTDFLSEAIAWWNRWLRNEDNQIDALPQVRAYMLDGPKPALRREEEPGFWVAKDEWSAPQLQNFRVGTDNQLMQSDAAGNDTGKTRDIYLKSPLDTGVASGEWFTLKPDAEMAGDQRLDDAGSLVFETAALDAPLDYLGFPEISLQVSCEDELANLAVRIVDVHPDGSSTRVSYGVLNLAHRDGNETPKPLQKGVKTTIRMVLDACGYRFGEGHKIRLSLSTAYWPMILPAPTNPGLTIDAGSITLSLPKLGEHQKITIPQPENADPLPHYISHQEGETRRNVERDLTSGLTHYRIFEDTGISEHPDTGLLTGQIRDEVWSISPEDPHSMRGSSTWTCTMQRGDWKLRTVSTAVMTCTEKDWVISAKITAFEGETQVFEKLYDKTIARDLM